MKSRHLTDSFRYAIDGLVYCLRTQTNMRIHLFSALMVLLLAMVLGVGRLEAAVLVATIGLVLFSEMINTAVEAAVDLTTGSYHPLARIAKNVAAGAVLVNAIVAVFVAFFVFGDDLVVALSETAGYNPPSPLITAPLSLVFTLLLTLGVRTFLHRIPVEAANRHTPSGFVAIAFCLAMWICLRTRDPLSSVFAVLGASIVAYSRVDTRAKAFVEVCSGAVIGVLGTTIAYILSLM